MITLWAMPHESNRVKSFSILFMRLTKYSHPYIHPYILILFQWQSGLGIHLDKLGNFQQRNSTPQKHYSFQKRAIHGMPCILLLFQNASTCTLLSIRSISLILSPSPLSLSLSSFFQCRGVAFPQNSFKKWNDPGMATLCVLMDRQSYEL